MPSKYLVSLPVLCAGLLLLHGRGGGDLATGRSAQAQPPASPTVVLPNTQGSLKFAVLGDFGTGDRTQLELAQQMARVHGRFKYELVVLVGDNIYGSERPQDFKRKFEEPYKPLLDAGVKFFATLGNHDAR